MCYTVYQTAEVEEEERHVEFLACVEVVKRQGRAVVVDTRSRVTVLRNVS